jgi:LDH2 family malate/lactate/ureidoglycolate dehydrogenase
MDAGILVNGDLLRTFCCEVFERLGVPHEDARIAADVLVEADLRGVSTHGVAALPAYAAALRQTGGVNPRPAISVVRDRLATAVLDGDGGLGHVVAVQAMRACIAKAKTVGIGSVAVRNSTHFGMAAYFAMMALPEEMIGFCTTNVEPVIVPPGGVDAVIGNNPQAYAIPAGECFPLVLDLAHSTVAGGKISLAARTGRSIPEGWAVNETGEPVTDPVAVLADPRLTPAGGAKGYALTVVMEALSGVLTGARFGMQLPGGHIVEQGVGHFFWAMRIDEFIEVADFKLRMDDLIGQMKQARPRSGVERIYVPGERGFIARAHRIAHGIPLAGPIWRDLETLAQDLGVSAPPVNANTGDPARRD